MHQEGKWLCALNAIRHSAQWMGYKKRSLCSEESNCSCFAPLPRGPQSLPPPLWPKGCPYSVLLKSQRQHVWGENGISRRREANFCLEPITLPVACSPFFVLWIRSLFLGFFWWTAECTRWSRLSACYLWQLAEGWTVCTCAGESRIASCGDREKHICPLKPVCSSQSTRRHSFSLF